MVKVWKKADDRELSALRFVSPGRECASVRRKSSAENEFGFAREFRDGSKRTGNGREILFFGRKVLGGLGGKKKYNICRHNIRPPT